MKLKTFIFMLAVCSLAQAGQFTVKLCKVGCGASILSASIMGEDYVKGPSGVIYRASFGPTEYTAEDHINITAEQLDDYAEIIPTLNKSIAISGIDDPAAFMAAFGLVRCNADGSEFGFE